MWPTFAAGIALQMSTVADSAMNKRPLLSDAMACTAKLFFIFLVWLALMTELVEEIPTSLDCSALALAARTGSIEISLRRFNANGSADLNSRLGLPVLVGG